MFEREGWKSGDGVREEASAYPAVRAPSSMLLLTVPTSSWQVQIAEVYDLDFAIEVVEADIVQEADALIMYTHHLRKERRRQNYFITMSYHLWTFCCWDLDHKGLLNTRWECTRQGKSLMLPLESIIQHSVCMSCTFFFWPSLRCAGEWRQGTWTMPACTPKFLDTSETFHKWAFGGSALLPIHSLIWFGVLEMELFDSLQFVRTKGTG
ncbi:uncharacterized protein [Triticum aestivum]|nr:uncharacterized protein LOC123165846 isoform X2 [Triticum aestivum]